MNRALILATLRQRLSSPGRIAFLALFLLPPLAVLGFLPRTGLGSLVESFYLVLVLGAGMIGQDFSTGVLQLLFARPVRRSEYVLSRWFAVGAAASGLALAQLAIAALLVTARGVPLQGRELALLAGSDVVTGFGSAAVLALFSSLAGGFGDLALLLAVKLMGGMIEFVGRIKAWALVARLGGELSNLPAPQIDLGQVFGGGMPSWYDLASYFSTVTLCLALAIVAVNRKELSYASAG